MPPKKKLSKKEKARLEAEQAELLRIEMEKDKLKKLEEARQRKKLEMEQAKSRQRQEIQENRLRRAQLKNCMSFFNLVQTTITAIKVNEQEQRDWKKFMRCNGLPNANNASDLRKYIHQWHSDITLRERESRNWLLRTDERTLLTQDGNIPDLTRATLRKQQGNRGDVYAHRIKEVLGILSELEETLEYKNKPYHLTSDLMRLKTEMRTFLKEYLDEFTYKTMSHIERDMEIDRPGVSKHIYDSPVFKSFVWTFSKDAQISINPKTRIAEQTQHSEIDFPTIEMQITLPPNVKLQSSALRGLWLNYDHFSDYCSSFNLKHSRPKNTTLLKQTKREWRKRKEILQSMLEECARDIPLSELEQLTQDQNSSGSQQPKERSYDVDKLYTEYEDELNKLRRRTVGPEAYGLLETDVNLRKYRIIGGVYCIDFLEVPQQDKQLNAQSFIRTIVTPNRLNHKEYYQTYKPPPPVQPGVRRLPEEIEAEMRMIEAALDKLAQVTLQLPDSVIWFEPPIACRWETHMEKFESDFSDSIKQPTTIATPTEATPLSTNPNPSPLKSSPRFPAKIRNHDARKSNAMLTLCEINDFDMRAIPNNIDIYGLVKDFVVPRLPIGFCVRLNKAASDTASNNTTNRKKRVLFLAHQPHMHVGELPDGELYSINSKHRSVSQLSIHNKEQRIETQLNDEFLDLSESMELFPILTLDKMLKFKISTSKERTFVIPQTNKQQLQQPKTYTKIKGAEKAESVLDDKPYMFSQLIEDLDHLWQLQLPPEQQEVALNQISEILSVRSSQQDSTEANGNVNRDNGGSMQPLSAELVEVLQPATAAAAFAYYTGISFVRDPGALLNGDAIMKTTSESEVESAATDTSSTDDEDDDENDCCNVNVEDITALAGQTSGFSDSNVHNFLSEHSQSDSDSKQQNLNNIALLTQGKWSTRDVHDTKFNEDKLSIQFRTGRLGVFGFALNRYSNMPYQTWDLRPEMKNSGTILFSFTASLVSMDMTITSSGYTVNNFQGGSTQAITNMLGKTLSLTELKTTLISSAVDIFPDEDAFCYTEGSCEKNFVMEKHLYACISTLALSHNFSWSRWNLLAGTRTAVLLIRELIEGKKVPYYSTLLVTPLKTSIIDCTEVSASFNAVGIPGMEYYADLYQLSQEHAQPISLAKQSNMDPLLRDNVARILMAIRPLSFC